MSRAIDSLANVRHWRMVLACLVVTCLTVVWFGWVSRGGLGHAYYSASARTLASNPSWFMSGAFDPAGFITVDKPPIGVWATAIGSAFGGSHPVALILPNALLAFAAAGLCAATTPMGWRSLAFVVILVIPGLGVLARTTLPDATMLFLGSAAAYVALEVEGRRRWSIAGCLLAAAVLAKPGAVLMAPAFVVLWLSSPHRSMRQLVTFLSGFLLTLSVWVLLAELTPHRPYFGGTTGDAALEQLVGPAVVDRVLDGSLTSADRWIGLTSAGEPGLLRTVTGRLGLQAGYLLVFALLGSVRMVFFGLEKNRSAAIFWWTWLVVHAAVFSFLPGIAHAYYGASLALPVGVLSVLVVQAGYHDWLAIFGAAGSVLVLIELVRSPLVENGVVVLVLATLAAVVVGAWATTEKLENSSIVAVFAMAIVAMGFVSTNQLLLQRSWDFDPAAGDRGSLTVSYVEEVRNLVGDAPVEWSLVTDDETLASLLVAEHQRRVVLVGGFLSLDPAVSADELRAAINAGGVGYILEPDDVRTPGGRVILEVLDECRRVNGQSRLRDCRSG